jgi:hypothetical protein
MKIVAVGPEQRQAVPLGNENPEPKHHRDKWALEARFRGGLGHMDLCPTQGNDCHHSIPGWLPLLREHPDGSQNSPGVSQVKRTEDPGRIMNTIMM